MQYANNKGADQPAHPRSLVSTFVVRCLDSIIPLVSISEISSLYIASVAAQASLSLPWSQTPKTGSNVLQSLATVDCCFSHRHEFLMQKLDCEKCCVIHHRFGDGDVELGSACY